MAACAVLAASAALWSVRGGPSDRAGAVRHRARRRAGRQRSKGVEREVPLLLDLLAAGSTAGLSAELSLRRAADALRGPLGEEVRAIAEMTDLGARWRDELESYATRTGSVDL